MTERKVWSLPRMLFDPDLRTTTNSLELLEDFYPYALCASCSELFASLFDTYFD